MRRQRGVRRRSIVTGSFSALAAAPWLLRAASARAAPAGYDVLQLKTAIVGRIAEFVRWPSSAGLEDPQRALELVLVGGGPLEASFQRYYGESQRVPIAGHRVFFRRARTIDDIGRPHVLFVTAGAEGQLDAILAAIGREPVLTVGDSDGLARRGVAVNLYLANDQVRFEISRRALERHGLQASYRLLALARLIDDQQARR